MKYDHAVIYNGRYYAAGVEIEEVGAEVKAPTSDVAETPVVEEEVKPMTKRRGRSKKEEA